MRFGFPQCIELLQNQRIFFCFFRYVRKWIRHKPYPFFVLVPLGVENNPQFYWGRKNTLVYVKKPS